jgi:toxic protein SymE
VNKLTDQGVACNARVPRQSTHYKIGYDSYPGKQPHIGDRRAPVLRLSGLWLEQLGFAIGRKVQITCRDGRLVMELTNLYRD